METTGTMGHRMMQQTATVQSNFDYSDERDACRKLRVAMAMSPVLVAMTANSPIVDGAPSGYKSFRAKVWQDTDPARCGILPFVFDTENVFGAYARWALDVPMYFVWRDGTFLPAHGMTFRGYMDRGLDGARATLADWSTHLTTLFPEARLKTYLEVRAADSQPVELMLGTPALMKGILYDSDCLDAAWDVLRSWSLDERITAGEDAARLALEAKVRRHRLADYARDLVAIGRVGLARQAQKNSAGDDETVYLEALARDVASAECPADRLLRNWDGNWRGSLACLITESAYGR
jgi:glutamate--cysteine ligase